MELVSFGRRLHLGGGFVFEFQVGLEFCDCFFRVWWRLRVLAIVKEKRRGGVCFCKMQACFRVR